MIQERGDKHSHGVYVRIYGLKQEEGGGGELFIRDFRKLLKV